MIPAHPTGPATFLAPATLPQSVSLEDDNGSLQGHPFWSEGARAELELMRARPRDWEHMAQWAVSSGLSHSFCRYRAGGTATRVCP